MNDKTTAWDSSMRALRDGTSQADRVVPALSTDYALIDERTLEDLLQFAKVYAKELNYFNEYNDRAGDWHAFMNMDVTALASYLRTEEKERSSQQLVEAASQPHRALFFTFIKLLTQVQSKLNEFTRRHLDFYYRDILRLTLGVPQPDFTHVLFTLAHNVDQFKLPKNTRLKAGKDSAGKPLIYTTDTDILINRAEVAYLKNLFVDRREIGLKQIQERPDLLIALDTPIATELASIDKQVDRSVISMLSLALGEPTPGGLLPNYASGKPLTIALLNNIDTLLAFVANELYLTLPQFRLLMQLKEEVDNLAGWLQVNNYLEKAARKRLNDPHYQLPRNEPDHFEKNLMTALGLTTLDDFFAGLPEVEDIYDLYGRWDRPDVKTFIDEKLFLSTDDFKAMITIAYNYLVIWRRLYRILLYAGRRKQRDIPTHKLTKPNIQVYEKNKFEKLVSRTLGTLKFNSIQGFTISNLDQCYAEILHVEAYFFLAIESVAEIRLMHNRLRQHEQLKDWQWREIFHLLESARQEKEATHRRNTLKQKLSQSFEQLILFALGDPNPGDPLPDNKTLNSINADLDKDYIQSNLYMDVINFRYLQHLSKQHTLSAEDSDNAVRIVEQAQRRKRKIPPSVVSIDQWRNIYAFDDATSIQVQQQVDDEAVTPHWRTFGAALPTVGDEVSPVGRIGLAITSPILMLSEGTRTIFVTFAMDSDHFDQTSINKLLAQDQKPFKFQLSTDKEMIDVEYDINKTRQHVPQTGYEQALSFKIVLGPDQPAIAPLPVDDAPASPWPELLFSLADIPDVTTSDTLFIKHYRLFKELTLSRVRITVDVKDMHLAQLQNDQGAINPKKPFEPFGAKPAIGSRFYIAHGELCGKKLEALRLTIDWQGAPDNLKDHYLGYKGFNASTSPGLSPFTDNESITTQIILTDRRRTNLVSQASLFHADADKTKGASKTHVINITGQAIKNAFPAYDYLSATMTDKDITAWPRYWTLELQQDFLHAIYPRVAAICASRMDGDKPNPFIVNQPYTPKMNALRINYQASMEWVSQAADNNTTCSLAYLEPFGRRTIIKDSTGAYTFLPQFNDEGTLYIGIKGLQQAQSLTLLCQVAEGSGNPDIERIAPQWDYLSNDQWQAPDEGLIINDGSDGFIKSGVIHLKTPPAKPNQLLPSDAYWLRVRMPKNTQAIADMIAIKTQAVKATLSNDGYALDHYTKPLPPDSIKSLETPLSEIKTVAQPYSSVGGQGEEVASHFHTRVSERLRHKNRALTSWEYERLVLENFPDIYKVKCLPVGSSEDPDLQDTVQVIVVPNIKGKFPFDPFAPKVPADILLEIEKFLNAHSPPMAKILVKNPKYIHLQIRCGIRFRENTDTRYHSQLLKTEIMRFLSPWAYDKSANIVLGGSLNASLIINHLEQLPYVDYVAGINLFISTDGVNFKPITHTAGALDKFESELPEAVVVSAKDHVIDVIEEDRYEEKHFTGINYMRIEFDFQLASD